MYGILLREKGLHGEKVKEWCVEGPDSLKDCKVVDPVPPTGNISWLTKCLLVVVLP